MIRNELEQLRRTFALVPVVERAVYGIIIGMSLLALGLIINRLPIGTGFKVALFAIAAVTGIFTCFIIYRRQIHQFQDGEYTPNNATNDNSKNPSDSGVVGRTNQIIPSMPENPPTIKAEKNADESRTEDFEITDKDVIIEHKDENPALYRYAFSIKPVIFKIVLAVAFWLGVLITAITQQSTNAQNGTVAWWFFGALTPVVLIYCYYLMLRWKGEEFVVNDMWYERPLTMPFPFPSRTPAIRRSEIGKYEFKQTALDKLLGTCRLYSDTPSPDDKSFHNVKWLTHPAELRRATGISAPRKNSWLSPFQKDTR